MPRTLVGIVHYADDPDMADFVRIVHPEFDDRELDEPPTDGERRPYLKEDGTPHSWTTLGTDPARVAVLEKVRPDDPRVGAAMRKMFGAG